MLAELAAMPAPVPGPAVPDVDVMVQALCGQNMTKSQNAAGVLAYLALSSKECRQAISKVAGVAEALARLVASPNVDLQHNAALLLGQLSTGAEFRQVFGQQLNALPVLISRLTSEDTDIQCNVAWALRQLVTDSVHRDTMIKSRTASTLRPLLSSQDDRVKTNAQALIAALRRPPQITTDKNSKEQGALVGLASLSSAGSASESECNDTQEEPTADSKDAKRPHMSTATGAAKRAKWETEKTSGKEEPEPPESPQVGSAEEGINALLSATMWV